MQAESGLVMASHYIRRPSLFLQFFVNLAKDLICETFYVRQQLLL